MVGSDHVAQSSARISASPPCHNVAYIDKTIDPSINEDAEDTALSKPTSDRYESSHIVKWGIHWQAPTQMISFLLAGIALAVGHHCYYQSLVDTEVVPTTEADSAWDTDRQEWKIRFGTAFAFLAKTCLAASIATAYTQHIWAACRRKAYSISGLDAMFSATSDVFALTNLELALREKLGALLVVLVWLLPLSALITPATLTVYSSIDLYQKPGQVPLVYFPGPNDATGSSLETQESDNVYVWNWMPSAVLTRTSFAAASSTSLLAMPSGIPNATYKLNFYGPSLKCEEPSPELHGIIGQIVDAVGKRARKNEVVDVIYTAFTPAFGNYLNTNAETIDYGAYVDDCVLGGSTCPFSPGGVPTAGLNDTEDLRRSDPLVVSLLGKEYTCTLKNTSYSVMFRSSTGQTTLELKSYNWLDVGSSNDTTYGAIAMAVANILTGTYYAGNYSDGRAQPVAKCGLGSARTSIETTALMGLLEGGSDRQLLGKCGLETPAADLALIGNKTLGELVEELSRNVTLSLFSNDRFWSNTNHTTNITHQTLSNRYGYNVENLWTAYGVAIAVTLFSIAVGFHALYSNGVSYRTNFSTIVATTRSRVLDEVMIGSSLGAEPMRKDVMKTRLKFGVLANNEGEGVGDRDKGTSSQRAGFGLEAEVEPLGKGRCYY